MKMKSGYTVLKKFPTVTLKRENIAGFLVDMLKGHAIHYESHELMETLRHYIEIVE